MFEIFERYNHLQLIPVINVQQKPIGLIERNRFLVHLAGQYGRAVYGKRSVELVMDKSPLIVEGKVAAEDFARIAFGVSSEQLMNGFIIVENGDYIGVGTVIDLLKCTAAEREKFAKELVEIAENLKIANLAVEQQRRLAEAVIENIPSLVAVRSADTGEFLLVNRAVEAMLGVDRGLFVGKTPVQIEPAGVAELLLALERSFDSVPDTIICDMPFTRPADGEHRLLRAARIPVEIAEGKGLLLTVAEDVTESQRATARIEQLARFDILTGLANRGQFSERLNVAMAQSKKQPLNEPAFETAVLAIDMDRFKVVNDTLGHAAGDGVLSEVARRLNSLMTPDDLAARLGGDEFAILLAGEDAARRAVVLAGKLNDLLARPFNVSGQMWQLSGSIGIAHFPGDAAEGSELLAHADVALYRAKADGRGVWRQYDRSMHAGLQRRRELERALRYALERGELQVYFQPVINLATATISGFEALMRWRHPDLGYIAPDIFIPIAEEIGLIVPMGEWIIREACRMAGSLPGDLDLAINISAVQFRQPGLIPCIVQALARSGLPGTRLEVEVTESVLMEDEPQVLKTMEQLRDLGVGITLDDFGTGYASLSYLQRYPFNRIKIDKSFTFGLPGNRLSTAIVSAVTALASELGMATTAEGVETEDQLIAITRLGCSHAQGFHLGRPTPNPLAMLAASFQKVVNEKAS